MLITLQGVGSNLTPEHVEDVARELRPGQSRMLTGMLRIRRTEIGLTAVIDDMRKRPETVGIVVY